MDKFFKVDINGYNANLPIMTIAEGITIAFFNLHGDQKLTEHCGIELSKLAKGCDVCLTAESKALQLTHVVARSLNQDFYAVARKEKKSYMQDAIMASRGGSITSQGNDNFYLSKHDAELLKGKKVAIIDDVVSTGKSLIALEKLVELAGGTVESKLFVLAEGDASKRQDVKFLASIPLL